MAVHAIGQTVLAQAAASSGSTDWTAGGIDLSTLVDIGTLDATYDFASATVLNGSKLSGELAANGEHGWSVVEVADGVDVVAAARVSLSWIEENMSDGSRGALAGLVWLDYDDDAAINLAADNYDGVGIRQSSSVTSFQYGNPNGTDFAAVAAFHDGASPYQGKHDHYDLVLHRDGTTGAITGYALAGETLTRVTTPSAALGTGPGRICIIGHKTNADTGCWVNVLAVRTEGLTIDGPQLVVAT